MAASSRPRRSLRRAVKATKQQNQSEVSHDGTKTDDTVFLQEVPFETLKSKRGLNAKESHKSLMSLSTVRLGGIVGRKDGSFGVLTYGSYFAKDRNLMNSIVPITSTFEESPVMTKKSVPAAVIPHSTAVKDMPNFVEVPEYLLLKKTPSVHSCHKAQMSRSMIQKGGGLYGEKMEEGVGFVVYGSFGSADRLEF
ncbi:hypothetical protein ACP70R_049822 [Stipagrostis hirtigluma subsp. patula]